MKRWICLMAALCALTTLGFAKVKPFTFVHITDTHVSETSKFEELKQYVEVFNQLSPRPAYVVNSGDVTELGQTGEYKKYLETVKPLKPKRVDVPGNHDVRWSPLGKEGFSTFLGKSYRSWDHNGCHFVSLDSTALLEHWGHFEKGMLDWLRKE